MADDPEVRQLTNSQTQAGAAAQLIVNIFLVNAGGSEWVVKPIAFRVESDGPPTDANSADSGARLDIQMEAGKRSNTQGQGLAVTNEVNLLDVIGRAIGAASRDPEVQAALAREEVRERVEG